MRVHDVVGIGIGPFNLGLAALSAPLADLDVVFLDAADEFRWHPGMMIEGATIQVPFLADLPFIGNLFKKQGRSKEKAELLIFVTPKVLTVAQRN